jgi:hypothetical protein
MTAGLIGGRRARELLWSNLRLVVLDIETLWETGSSLTADADAETQAAIEQDRSTGVPVRLRARKRRVRYFEHQAIEAAGPHERKPGQRARSSGRGAPVWSNASGSATSGPSS